MHMFIRSKLPRDLLNVHLTRLPSGVNLRKNAPKTMQPIPCLVSELSKRRLHMLLVSGTLNASFHLGRVVTPLCPSTPLVRLSIFLECLVTKSLVSFVSLFVAVILIIETREGVVRHVVVINPVTAVR